MALVSCACMIAASFAGVFGSAEASYESGDGDILPVSINGNADPNFTIQRYFWFPQVVRGGTGTTFPFIDTENDTHPGENKGGKLPKNSGKNGTSSTTRYNGNWDIFRVQLLQDSSVGGQYRLNTVDVLTQLFADEPTSYRKNPQITYMNRLYNGADEYNGNYILTEVWVYQPTAGGKAVEAEKLMPEQFTVYMVPAAKADASGTVRHYPERVRFTNNPANPNLTLDSRGELNDPATG